MRAGTVISIAAAAVLLGPASAAAATRCVNDPACPPGGSSAPSIAAAVAASASGDQIMIGPGIYAERVDDGGKSLTFAGAGSAQTIVQAPTGTATMTLGAGSTASGLGIELPASGGGSGLLLAGSATGVAVTAAPGDAGGTGVELQLGSFSHGAVTLPTDIADTGVTGNGTLSDSSVTAQTGVAGVGAVHRARITANQAVSNVAAIDDSLIVTMPGPDPELGVGVSGAANTVARHLTVVGSGSGGSVGLSAAADGSAGPVGDTLAIDSSIIRGYAASVAANASGGASAGDSAIAAVTIAYSEYDPMTAQRNATPGVAAANATISADGHSSGFDPLFIDPANGDFHLLVGSPAIDAGDPGPLAAGESTTDLDANPRVVDGRHTGKAIADMGAFEYQPHPPIAVAAASATTTGVGTRVSFTAVGSSAPDPGDRITKYAWRFDDGIKASGPSVRHAFTATGTHTATLTVTDVYGRTGSARVSVRVLPPMLSGLRLKPRSFAARRRGGRSKRHHGTIVSYRDTQSATTTLTVQKPLPGRMVGHSCRKPSRRNAGGKRCTRYMALGGFDHRDRAGANALRFDGRIAGHALAVGSYRLQAVPRNVGGVGAAVYAPFRIIR